MESLRRMQALQGKGVSWLSCIRYSLHSGPCTKVLATDLRLLCTQHARGLKILLAWTLLIR